jgi:hypothetical protein
MIKSLVSALFILNLATVAGFCQTKIDPGQINWPSAAGCGDPGALYNPATNRCVTPFHGGIDATLEPGSDLGAKIDYAYNSDRNCAGGCRIVIPPGSFDVSTPIVIATKGKNASIECSGTSTTMTWTPSSGAMFQFAANGAGTGNGWGEGIKDCSLASTSTTATAVQFGVNASDSSGRTAQGAYLDNVQITGFGTQYDLESQAWNITVNHSEFLNPARYAIFANPSAVNSGENLSFVGITVANSLNTWMPRAVNLSLGSVIAQFVGGSFDNAQIEMGAGTINLISPYFENPGPVLRTTPWIDVRHAVSTITGLTAADDQHSIAATQPAITVEGTLTWIGGTIFGADPATATVVTRGGGHVFLAGDLNVSAAVPLLVNNSGLPFTNLTRDTPAVVNGTLRLSSTCSVSVTSGIITGKIGC